MKPNILSHVLVSMLMAGSALTGCHDDDGNYSYVDLDKVEIACGDSDEPLVLTLERGEEIMIDPEIYYNGKLVVNEADAPLKYMWTFYSAMTGNGIDYTVDTLATTRQLDAVINRSAGTYYAQLTVTNANTGIEAYYRATCNVEEAISAGWMLLYERADMPGYSDVGLVMNPFNKKNIQRNKEFWNLYSSSNGNQPLEGLPVNIFHETVPLSSGGTPRITTTKDIAVVSTATFEKVMGWEDLFYDAPAITDIKWYNTTTKMGSCNALIMDDMLRIRVGNMSTGVGYFGLPKRYSEDLGELAAWSSTRCSGNAVLESVVYSQTNGAFYYSNTSMDLRPFLSQDPAAARFDVNNTGGARLLYGDWGAAFHDYFLFAIGDKRYIAEANFSGMANLQNIGSTWADVSDAPRIREATSFATNFIGRYAYYSAGNTLYDIAYDNGRVFEAWVAPDPNEVITCVRTHKYHFLTVHNMMMPNVNTVVHIATWNESAGHGKLYEYRINPASGQILTDGESYEYTVPGKVGDMGWKYEMAM
ncbi:MAG: PKD-like family lipoprotein [Paenibacillus sp.]|nr:PKD-like family lipoprotein [Paenibacillus sp.]